MKPRQPQRPAPRRKPSPLSCEWLEDRRLLSGGLLPGAALLALPGLPALVSRPPPAAPATTSPAVGQASPAPATGLGGDLLQTVPLVVPPVAGLVGTTTQAVAALPIGGLVGAVEKPVLGSVQTVTSQVGSSLGLVPDVVTSLTNATARPAPVVAASQGASASAAVEVPPAAPGPALDVGPAGAPSTVVVTSPAVGPKQGPDAGPVAGPGPALDVGPAAAPGNVVVTPPVVGPKQGPDAGPVAGPGPALPANVPATPAAAFASVAAPPVELAGGTLGTRTAPAGRLSPDLFFIPAPAGSSVAVPGEGAAVADQPARASQTANAPPGSLPSDLTLWGAAGADASGWGTVTPGPGLAAVPGAPGMAIASAADPAPGVPPAVAANEPGPGPDAALFTVCAPFDAHALDVAFRRLLDQLEGLAWDFSSLLARLGRTPWFVSAALLAVTCEMARRQLRHRARGAVALAGDGGTLTWFPSPTGPGSREEP
jgi:hypothetical protein